MKDFGDPGQYGLALADFEELTREQDSPTPHPIGTSGEISGCGALLPLFPDSDTVLAVLRNDDHVDTVQLAQSQSVQLGLDRDPGH